MKDVHLRFTDDDAKVIDDIIHLAGVSVSAFSRIAILSFARLILKRAETNPDIWADTIGKESESGFIEITDSPVVIAAALKKYKAMVRVQDPARPVSKPVPGKHEPDDGWEDYFVSVEEKPLTDEELARMDELSYPLNEGNDFRERLAREHAEDINAAK